MKKLNALFLFAVTLICLPAISQTNDSTNVVETATMIENIAHTLIPNTGGGVIANTIITIVGILIPSIYSLIKRIKSHTKK